MNIDEIVYKYLLFFEKNSNHPLIMFIEIDLPDSEENSAIVGVANDNDSYYDEPGNEAASN